MAEELKNYVNSCVVSFIDLYFKTKRNFPGVREVSPVQQEEIIRAFASIGRENGIKVRTCCENPSLEKCGVDVSGCMTQSVIEEATGCSLNVPKAKKAPRAQCNCLLEGATLECTTPAVTAASTVMQIMICKQSQKTWHVITLTALF